MFHYLLELQFSGTYYCGWQIQPDQITVQGVLNAAIQRIIKTDKFKTTGSGRTDSGVHAHQFFVKLSMPKEMPHASIRKSLNSHLPMDVRVISCQSSKEDFRPTNDALEREYRYYFTNLEQPQVFLQNKVSNISYDLDVEKMNKAASLFMGEHDFSDFYTEGSSPSTPVREIYKCEIHKCESSMDGLVAECYVLVISGNGFLKQMVRLIMGTIWNAGRTKVQLAEIENALSTPTGNKLAAVAPPDGLYKYSVTY